MIMTREFVTYFFENWNQQQMLSGKEYALE